MDRGIYSAASGGLVNTRRIEIVSNNLANVNTVGFKAQRLATRQQRFEDTLASTLNNVPLRAEGDFDRTPGAVSIATATDFTPGPISHTGNPLHVALRAKNTFFVVETPEGEAYTRAGNFTLDGESTLITPDGFPVVGEGGAITLPPGQPHISSNGTVSVNGESAGRVRVVQVEDTSQLERTGGVRFTLRGGARPSAIEADVVPQSVEMPNVSVVEAIVELINAQRGFDAYTKTAKTIDELNARAIRNSRANG